MFNELEVHGAPTTTHAIVLSVETIRIPRVRGCGPPGAAVACTSMNLEIRQQQSRTQFKLRTNKMTRRRDSAFLVLTF